MLGSSASGSSAPGNSAPGSPAPGSSHSFFNNGHSFFNTEKCDAKVIRPPLSPPHSSAGSFSSSALGSPAPSNSAPTVSSTIPGSVAGGDISRCLSRIIFAIACIILHHQPTKQSSPSSLGFTTKQNILNVPDVVANRRSAFIFDRGGRFKSSSDV